MNKNFIIALIVLILFAASFYLLPYLKRQEMAEMSGNGSDQPESFQARYHYPMTEYNERRSFRWFGKNISASEKTRPCGSTFVGIHTADDLEILSGEKEQEVPVFSISDSEVIETSFVSGYGGLLVLSTNFEGQDYTLYYGHVDLTKTNIKNGDKYKSGERLVDLSKECSDESGGERKHLHFGIRKGEKIDVRGYVSSASELKEWENPKQFLETIKAMEPNINAYGNKNFVRFPINIKVYLLYIYKVITGR